MRVELWRKLSTKELMLEKTLESPLDCKEIQLVHPKGDQSSVFIGRTDVEAETQILWPPNVKNWLTGKDPDAGKDWRQKEKGTPEPPRAHCTPPVGPLHVLWPLWPGPAHTAGAFAAFPATARLVDCSEPQPPPPASLLCPQKHARLSPVMSVDVSKAP